uniref:Cell death inducing DFFA like effector b n=1 Tax=Oryzias sinensis TaxID=183150 RepID=A0A8C7XBN5_9TELE
MNFALLSFRSALSPHQEQSPVCVTQTVPIFCPKQNTQKRQGSKRGEQKTGKYGNHVVIDQACQALLMSLSALSLCLVCEEDGTEVDSDEFLMTLPDNIMLMALRPGQAWSPQAGSVVLKDQNKPRTGRDIARVTFDLYRISPKDVFGSLNVKATFQGLYSVSADFQCLGPKKVLREMLRVASTLLQAAGHLLITTASMIRRIIEGTELWQPQRAEYTAKWN